MPTPTLFTNTQTRWSMLLALLISELRGVDDPAVSLQVARVLERASGIVQEPDLHEDPALRRLVPGGPSWRPSTVVLPLP